MFESSAKYMPIGALDLYNGKLKKTAMKIQ